MKKTVCVGMLAAALVLVPLHGTPLFTESFEKPEVEPMATMDDLDPLVDLSIDVTVSRVRSLDIPIGNTPELYATVSVGSQQWESATLNGHDVFDVGTGQFDVLDDERETAIIIEVFKNGALADCADNGQRLEITYDVTTGTWTGDDALGDESGYGHASGHEDGDVDATDVEVWFTVSVRDYDGDGLTYWEEVNVYGTDPAVDDTGRDDDNDGIPIEWEDFWGYDPFSADEHGTLDPDADGIQNDEEYFMREWLADPFRQDLYVENDYLAEHNGVTPVMPEEALQLQYSAFAKHDIMMLVDTGSMGGSETIPYERLDEWDDFHRLYEDYFLHNDDNHPRRGVFHYAVIMHEFDGFGRGVGGFNYRRDAIAIASAYVQKWRPWEEGMIVGHGGTYMHEMGHQLGLPHLSVFPWQVIYWLSFGYKSCMNYRYNFKIVDYSEGGGGFLDRDEWGNLDLRQFEQV